MHNSSASIWRENRILLSNFDTFDVCNGFSVLESTDIHLRNVLAKGGGALCTLVGSGFVVQVRLFDSCIAVLNVR